MSFLPQFLSCHNISLHPHPPQRSWELVPIQKAPPTSSAAPTPSTPPSSSSSAAPAAEAISQEEESLQLWIAQWQGPKASMLAAK